MSEWTEGVAGDGAVILRDGQPVSISEVLGLLSMADALTGALDRAVTEKWNAPANAVIAERAAISEEARRYAGHYSAGSDGRNTFILLAEWIEAR